MLGLGILRLVRVFGAVSSRKFLKRETPEQKVFYQVILLSVSILLIGWGYYLQLISAKNLYLCYSDWGIYVESYLKLGFSSSWKNWLSSGAHWNPLVNVLLTGFVRLFPFQEALFLFNSMLIYTAVPLTWLLCRKIGLNLFHSFCFAMAAAFSPVYANLSVCLFYGFHPIYFCIPLLLLFFMFRETDNRIGMAVCLTATLLVQETMMIFWFGYGLWLLARRRRLTGILFAVGGLAGFLILSGFVIPVLVDRDVYQQTCLYSTLGNSISELILSPFVRPADFWKVCSQWQNFAYLAVLLLPCFFCVWLFPDMMIAVLPLLTGICLRSSPEIKSIVFQYGTETSTLLLALSVINFNRILICGGNLWCSILFFGVSGKKCPRGILLNSFAVVMMLTAFTTHFCFALTMWGKYQFRTVWNMPDGSEVINAIRGKLPPRVRVLASIRLRTPFMYEHPTEDFARPRKTGDHLLLALHDRSIDTAEKLERIRREIAFDSKVIPMDSFDLSGRHIVMFKVTDGKELSPIPKLRQISASEFMKIGVPLPVGSPDFKIRYLFQNNRHVFLIRLEKTLDYDFDFIYQLSGPWGKIRNTQVFGWGLYPAYACPPGTLFIVERSAPQAASVNCFCLERKASRFKR